jgi:hypothetical protein
LTNKYRYMTALAEALYLICEEDGDTSVVESIRNKALEKIVGGEAKSLLSSTVNSKSFTFSISKPADKIFEEASQAIMAFRGTRYTASEVDFSGL